MSIDAFIGISNQSITDFNLLLEPNLDFQYAMGLLGKEANVLQYQVTNEGICLKPCCCAITNCALQADLDSILFNLSYCSTPLMPTSARLREGTLLGSPNSPRTTVCHLCSSTHIRTHACPLSEDCGDKPRADVISISYLQGELDFGLFFTQRQCTEYGKVCFFFFASTGHSLTSLLHRYL